jgi:hypothetical protein
MNREFECVWESVRPVPTVSISFGDGNVVKRTLHGNIATWVTDSTGRVIDVLPGIFIGDVYVVELTKILHTARGARGMSNASFS